MKVTKPFARTHSAGIPRDTHRWNDASESAPPSNETDPKSSLATAELSLPRLWLVRLVGSMTNGPLGDGFGRVPGFRRPSPVLETRNGRTALSQS